MKALFHVPIVLSLLLLGAHFLRFDFNIGVIGIAVLIVLLFLRTPWVARLAQITLLAGAVEWAYTLYQFAQLRAAEGEPYTRLAVILGAVILVAVGSALLFQTQTMKAIYGLDKRTSDTG